MKDYAAIQTFSSGAFPDVVAVDSSGAATPDGTEYIAAQINNGIFGPQQALMEYAGLTPDGVIEAAGGGAQFIEAFIKAYGIGPGKLVGWFLDDDPSVTGDRVLLLEGQGILIASYPELTAAVYVGDAANAAVHAGGGKFYKSSDAGGATPNTAGPYLQLPEARGYTLRGLDSGASVDPDGASRFLGDVQADAMQRITGTWSARPPAVSRPESGVFAGDGGSYNSQLAGGTTTGEDIDFDSSWSTTPNAAKTDDIETRMSNLSIKFGITY